jgi:hypothetical protein
MSSTDTPGTQDAPQGPTITELAEWADLDDEALAVLSTDSGLKANLERLVDEGFQLEAVRVLAHALPPRGAVWWGWGCAKQAAGDEVPDGVRACLEATEAWLAEPTDVRRRAAGAVGNEAKDASPASMAAMAVLLAEGSTSPPELPHTDPPPHVSAKLASGAVGLAALGDDPETVGPRLERFLKQGMEVARKSGLWGEE